MSAQVTVRIAFDLSKLAMSIKGDRRWIDLCRHIEEFASACSIRLDLEECLKSLMIIEAVQMQEELRDALGKAMMDHAVIAYCRATVSRSEARRHIDFKKVFTKDQFQKHKGITDLRSTSIAHYHIGKGPYADNWVDDRIVVKEIDGVIHNPVNVYKRRNFRASAVADLFEIANVALDAVHKQQGIRQVRLRSELAAALSTDDILAAKMRSLPFDHSDFFDGHIGDFWSDQPWYNEAFKAPD